MVNVELPRQAGGRVSVLDAKLAAGPIAIGVDRGFRHAEFARDLLRRQMLIHEPQAFAFAGRKQPDGILGNDVARDHGPPVNDDLARASTLTRSSFDDQLHSDAQGGASMDPKDPGRTAQIELVIGARMRTRRRQLGLSQSDLAARLGVSFQQVQKYERGANRVAASTLLAAAQALGTSIGWLVGEEVSGRDDDEDVFRALSRPGALEILQAFNAIADLRTRTALLALAKEMASRDAV
jgi:transcriptional regulator with XRE-family HTH domain